MIGLGLNKLEQPAQPHGTVAPIGTAPSVVLPNYFRFKYVMDFLIAAALLILGAPLLMLVGGIAVVDAGWPILFWQQRLGVGGRTFVVRKIRTLRPPFDQMGAPIPENKRLSKAGSILRKTRLDELPQLLNVLVGDMSLIGPRPLLPRDQPAGPSVRLRVRPGITGWAQVNGGTLLSPSEKDRLDEWYVRNASFWLDLRILAMTLRMMVWGQRRPKFIAGALAAWDNAVVEPRLSHSEELAPVYVPQVSRRRGAGIESNA